MSGPRSGGSGRMGELEMRPDANAAELKAAQPRGGCCCGPRACAPDDARDILERRYANGEITREQYEDIRRGLESDRSRS